MYCTNCGNQMDPNSKFCTKCGANVNGVSNNQVTNTNKKKVSIGSCIGTAILISVSLYVGTFILNVILNLVTGYTINENIISMLIYFEILFILFGPVIIYLIKSNKTNNS